MEFPKSLQWRTKWAAKFSSIFHDLFLRSQVARPFWQSAPAEHGGGVFRMVGSCLKFEPSAAEYGGGAFGMVGDC